MTGVRSRRMSAAHRAGLSEPDSLMGWASQTSHNGRDEDLDADVRPRSSSLPLGKTLAQEAPQEVLFGPVSVPGSDGTTFLSKADQEANPESAAEASTQLATEIIPLNSEKQGKVTEAVKTHKQTCIICYGSFTRKHPQIAMPCEARCNTAPVHTKCIFEWIQTRSNGPEIHTANCPLCRGPLKPIVYVPQDPLHMNRLVQDEYRRRFCLRPVPRSAGVVCAYLRVIRVPAKLGGYTTQYEMVLQAANPSRYPNGPMPPTDGESHSDHTLMVARRRPKLGSMLAPVVDISLDTSRQDFDPNSKNHVGVVSSSSSGLVHSIFAPNTSEVAPIRRRASAFSRNRQRLYEVGAVKYTQNRVGRNVGPRRMQVALPKVCHDAYQGLSGPPQSGATPAVAPDVAQPPNNLTPSELCLERGESLDEEDEEEPAWATRAYRPAKSSQTMRRLLRRDPNKVANSAELVHGANKQPYWLATIQAFSLDFSGRVTLPSNKNFQLVLEGDPAMPMDGHEPIVVPTSGPEIHLQFGKTHASPWLEVYTLDLRWPMSPLQAFGIAISACVRKLAVA